jgi:hypothetical protein
MDSDPFETGDASYQKSLAKEDPDPKLGQKWDPDPKK